MNFILGVTEFTKPDLGLCLRICLDCAELVENRSTMGTIDGITSCQETLVFKDTQLDVADIRVDFLLVLLFGFLLESGGLLNWLLVWLELVHLLWLWLLKELLLGLDLGYRDKVLGLGR